jgi:hypothetical protein
MSAATPEPPAPGEAGGREVGGPGEPASATAGQGGNGAPEPQRPEIDWEELAAHAGAHFGAIARDVRTLVDVGSEKARDRLRRARWGLVRWVVLGLLGAGVAVGGTVYFVRGLAGALATLLGGRTWLGELATGVLLLVSIVVGVRIARALDERGELQRLRREFERARRAEGDGGDAP